MRAREFMADRTPKGSRLPSPVLDLVESYEDRIRSLIEGNECLRKLEALQESEIDQLKSRLLEYERLYDASVLKVQDLVIRQGHVLSIDEIKDLLSHSAVYTQTESLIAEEPANGGAFKDLEETVTSAAESQRAKARIQELENQITLSLAARSLTAESKVVQTEAIGPPIRARLMQRTRRMLDPPTPIIVSSRVAASTMRPQFVFPQSSRSGLQI